MNDLQAEITAWTKTMFPNSRRGLIQHFQEEVAELVKELDASETNEQNLREECADVMHFLFQIAGQHGFDLIEETRRKFEINQARTWAASEDGIVRHVDTHSPS